ncbi:putative fibroblast growth factor 1 isoform X2 [Scleropages formosus]|uniref:Fibroblast growth factor n=1 Tax=Scleropages formosus TaxID=113540 RepID=A0A8C9V774_SCLFO|nr:fibroblast growth factor 1 isoform X2 [Scleropages formosus]
MLATFATLRSVAEAPFQLRSAAPRQPHATMTDGEVSLLGAGMGVALYHHTRPRRLYCLNGGFHLRILADGTVEGSRDEDDPYNVLRVKAVSIGVVVIEGMEGGCYLAMDQDGQLYGSPTLNDECYFFEKLEENHYNTYMSQKYRERSWYVGIKKNGRPKAGPRTHIGQKAIYFLPRALEGASE